MCCAWPPYHFILVTDLHRACTFTLLDVLGEIYWEIGFHGSPDERDQAGAELLESVREIEEGRDGLIPWEPSEEKVN